LKALILNSGMGKRMGALAAKQHKCMSEILPGETILSRQLRQLADVGVTEIIITTGPFDKELADYCRCLELPVNYTFVKNEQYASTNYIYSIYCAREYLNDDIILLHGDLVFENRVIDAVLENGTSCVTVSSSVELPQKDFKAVTKNGKISKIGIEFFENAVSAQPLYKLLKDDWHIWLSEIVRFCENGDVKCYAENAFNNISDKIDLFPVDIRGMLCAEIDTVSDYEVISVKLRENLRQTVYMCFSTDVLHSGHIAIIRKAARLGRLIIGVLSDEAIAGFKRFPLIPFEERKSLFENISGVYRVVKQTSLSYADILRELTPAFVVHGDDWREGFQKPIRDEVVNVLAEYGGRLIEYPYSNDSKYKDIDNKHKLHVSLPDIRRGKLRKLLSLKPLVRIIEAHNGITGLIAEGTAVYKDGCAYSFDGMWVSSLCDSTVKGKPDIELVDMSSRLRTIDEIMEVTTKPVILDGDTGGLTEHFVYNVRSLERLGVSAVIIEDKIGLKKNSLFGTEVFQSQDDIENFSAKIAAGKKAQKSEDFMIIARIESLILQRGVPDAITRAFAFTQAGADGIMIHSKKKDPAEIFEFIRKFRAKDKVTPVVIVPTSFNCVYEDEFEKEGVNIVIYANQLIRSAFPAMKKTAESILLNRRAYEADNEYCMSIKEIITLIPEE